MPVSADDYVSIMDFMGRYNWAVDEGDADGWANCFTEDGVFAGALPQDPIGREALRQIPLASGSVSGPMRHITGNLHCDYGDDKDTVIARYYNLVSLWEGEGKLSVLSIATAKLLRNGDSWLIKRSDNIMLPRPS
ncbi:MAG: nuclear transport factor 2 family protein [Sphingomonadaceae bacterium]|nr:nuclear transport factor 2 family protein [Sphingomonadaceae bacterium]